MGYNARQDAVLTTLAGLETVLAAEGFRLPRGAGVVNLARGRHVVDADLLAALASGASMRLTDALLPRLAALLSGTVDLIDKVPMTDVARLRGDLSEDELIAVLAYVEQRDRAAADDCDSRGTRTATAHDGDDGWSNVATAANGDVVTGDE